MIFKKHKRRISFRYFRRNYLLALSLKLFLEQMTQSGRIIKVFNRGNQKPGETNYDY